MPTLFSSILAVPTLLILWRRLRPPAVARSETRPLPALTLDQSRRLRWLTVGFWLIVLFGWVLGEGPSTAVLFIAAPLTYLIWRPRWLTRLVGWANGRFWRTWFLIFWLLFPLDLSVGIDAGRDLGEHMLSMLGFYIGLSWTVTFLLRRQALQPTYALTVGGLWGVLIEQNFLGPTLFFSDPFAFAVFAPTIFLTYALFLLGPALLFAAAAPIPAPPRRWPRSLIFISVSVVPLLVWFVVNGLLESLGIPVSVLNV